MFFGMYVKCIWCHYKMVFYRITRGATTGISDPLQMFSGRLDEHDGMRFWPPILLTDITQFLLAHGDVALTNDMLKNYKVGKVYEYFLSGWLQEAYFLKTKSNNNKNLHNLFLRAKCSPS